MLVDDFNQIRNQIGWIWTNYKPGLFDAHHSGHRDKRRHRSGQRPDRRGHARPRAARCLATYGTIPYVAYATHEGFTMEQLAGKIGHPAYKLADEMFVNSCNHLHHLARNLHPERLILFNSDTGDLRPFAGPE